MSSYFKNNKKTFSPASFGETRNPELFFAGFPKMIPICILKKNLQEQFGPIKRLVIDKKEQIDQDNSIGAAQLHRGSGRITLVSIENTMALIEMGSFIFEGKLIHIREFISKKAKQQRDRSVLDERRKVYIRGIPRFYSSCKYFLDFFVKNVFLWAIFFLLNPYKF